jgi:hypothetical protein
MIPTGKGMFIWRLQYCAGGDPIHLAAKAVELGLSWVCIKAADGSYDFNQGVPGEDWAGPALLGPAISYLRGAGIRIWLWQYIYGADRLRRSIAAAEALAAVENIGRWQPDGWIVDPEKEYKRTGAAAWADQYMTVLRASCPSVSIGLCSYRWPTLHPELPWQSFLRRSNFHAPQVYWVGAHDPGNQLGRSVRELQALANLPVIPVGAAYTEPAYHWVPTVSDVNEFDRVAHQLNLPGITWWEWGENGRGAEFMPEIWEAIRGHQWGDPVVPPQAWDHALVAWARSLGYTGPGPG